MSNAYETIKDKRYFQKTKLDFAVIYYGENPIDESEILDAEEAAEQLLQLRADRENAYKEISDINTPMPCGHLARYTVNEKEGTQYCSFCEFENMQTSLDFVKGLFKSIQWNGESHGWLACPCCHELKKDGHSKDCELVKVIGEE